MAANDKGSAVVKDSTVKVPVKGTVPPAPTATTPPAASATPPTEAKAPRVKHKEIFDTEAAAVTEANSREAGPRRAFNITHGGKTLHVVAANQFHASGIALLHWGGVANEVGKAARAPRSASPDAIMAIINAMPEDQRAKILEQLAAKK